MGDAKTEPRLIDVEYALSQLNIDEKAALLSGVDFWHTAAIPRLSIPSIRMSDGPNGVRGTKFFNGVPAACFPCGTALGATWDTDLMRRAGALMATEARAKGAAVLLGPTINIQRSPLGGRGFESFSEDPYLAGSLAAAQIRGVQEDGEGIQATIKHFVCNDQEHERQAVDAVVSERAMREIYLMPFMVAMRDAGPKAFMTAYNKVNGTHVSENKRILQSILRDDWGFKGLVMSDWFGTYSISESINAGLDLEMPGQTNYRGKLVKMALGARKLTNCTIDERVRNVLSFVNRAIKSGVPEHAEELKNDTPETSKILRQIGADSLVLLKNERNILPLDKEKTVAIIGPNAKLAAFCGGGSASLRPYYAITPFDGISSQASDVKYALGATAFKCLPDFGPNAKTREGKAGFDLEIFLSPPTNKNRKPIDHIPMDTSNLFLVDYKNPKIEGELFFATLSGTFTPAEDGFYDFGLTCHGTSKLFVDGKLVVDNSEYQIPGNSFFGAGTIEEKGDIKLKGGEEVQILVEFGSAPTSHMHVPGVTSMGAGGVILGGLKRLDPAEEVAKAVKLAKEVDQVVVCAGLNSDWESEGFDRPNMHLPGALDTLIAAVADANPNVVLVMQSGTPVTMPWLSKVPALVQAWYGGNETGNAIADVLFGEVNPSGRLPLSWPVSNEDSPAFLSYRSELGKTVYTDDVFVGYRHYEKVGKNVAFPFGYGLSYTSFEISKLAVTSSRGLDGTIKVEVDVKNGGERSGAYVVQVWVAPPKETAVTRPERELKGYKKVFLKPGESKKVMVELAMKYAGSYWDEERDMWALEKGKYGVLVGDERVEFEVQSSQWWSGL